MDELKSFFQIISKFKEITDNNNFEEIIFGMGEKIKDLEKLSNELSCEKETLIKSINEKDSIIREKNEELATHNGLYNMLHPGEEVISYTKLYDNFYKKYTVNEINDVIKNLFVKTKMCVCMAGDNLPSLKQIKNECEKIK